MSENGQEQTRWTPPPAPASRVLAALSRLASMQDWGRVPIALIAQDTGYSERHIKRLLRQMDIKRTRNGHGRDIEGTSKGHEGDIEGTREGHRGDIEGTREGHRGDIEGTSKGHRGDIEGTSKGHRGDIEGTREGHRGDIEGTSKGHEGDIEGTSASLFPTGNGDEICSLVLSLPYPSPVPDPKILLDPKETHIQGESKGGDRPKTPRRVKIPLPESPEEQAALKASIVNRPTWQPWLIEKGLTHMNIDAQWEDFVLAALAHNYRYSDWYAAFQKWLKSPYQGTPRHATGRVYTAEDYRKAIAEDEAWRATL